MTTQRKTKTQTLDRWPDPPLSIKPLTNVLALPKPCRNCEGIRFWWRGSLTSGSFLCIRCYPPPNQASEGEAVNVTLDVP